MIETDVVHCDKCGAPLVKGMQFDGIVDMSAMRLRFNVRCAGCKQMAVVTLLPSISISVNGSLQNTAPNIREL